MSRRRLGLIVLLGAAACTPTLDPPWVLSRDRELAMRIEVVEQGPFGDSLATDEPSVNEALPLDTVEATPYVAGPDGEVDFETLQPRWYLCDDLGSCLLRVEPTLLPDCEPGFLVPEVPCRLPGGRVARFKLGDFFAAEDADAIFSINRAPTLGFVASTRDGPGTESCLERIGARQSLAGCLWMERGLSLGSLGEVVNGLQALGYDVEVSESLVPLLMVPRNHNPDVATLTVTIDGGQAMAYEPGSTVTVPVGAEVRLRHEADEDDIDIYEVVFDGEPVEVQDRLTGRWFASRELAEFNEDILVRSVLWRATDAEPVTVHFVVRDDRRGEAWGWLHFEFDAR